ncbi:MAG: hypothetical protein LBQ52_05210 [Helicobacteraceae bacterium]|nr:hypothetical protein [Helicobacteraceae bacterium]
MEKEALDILCDAISDVGYWQWRIVKNDAVQLEFSDTQLLDSDRIDKQSKSANIALRFKQNSFLGFYDNYENDNDWFDRLLKDEIYPFCLEGGYFEFGDKKAIVLIKNKYKNEHIIKANDNVKTKYTLAFKAGEIAVIAGGDHFYIYDNRAEIALEALALRNRLWRDIGATIGKSAKQKTHTISITLARIQFQ